MNITINIGVDMATLTDVLATLADVKVAVGQVASTVATLRAEVADLQGKTLDQAAVDAAFQTATEIKDAVDASLNPA